jgi:5,5'-dehydrodivanillate O-demethylase oxygenase subunit
MAGEDVLDLVHTGPGTLAGRYLRLFWQPVYRSRDLAPGQAVPVRILGEDLTLYRGEEGAAHLVAERCAHRGTQLSTGWVEGDCIRCLYHGWKYDAEGQCVEQPGEDAAFASKVRIKSYPTREYLGLVFGYFGEGEAPPLRRFPDFEREGVLAAGTPEYWPCNYFNRIDNASDGAHVPWTHRESMSRVNPNHRLTVRGRHSVETEYGVRNTSGEPDKSTHFTHFHMPNINQNRSVARVEGSLEDAVNLYVDRLFWRLPVDDTHCVSFVVDLVPLTGEAGEAYLQRRRQAEETQQVNLEEIAQAILQGKMRIRDVDRELSIYKLFWIEDYVVQCGQGPVADRAHERLGRVDAGVILLRQIWRRELKALAEGRPLKQWTTPAGLAEMSEGSLERRQWA